MNDCYSSQLIVSVSTSLNNKTIQCTHDSDMGLTLIGSTTLNFAYGKYLFIMITNPSLSTKIASLSLHAIQTPHAFCDLVITVY